MRLRGAAEIAQVNVDATGLQSVAHATEGIRRVSDSGSRRSHNQLHANAAAAEALKALALLAPHGRFEQRLYPRRLSVALAEHQTSPLP